MARSQWMGAVYELEAARLRRIVPPTRDGLGGDWGFYDDQLSQSLAGDIESIPAPTPMPEVPSFLHDTRLRERLRLRALALPTERQLESLTAV